MRCGCVYFFKSVLYAWRLIMAYDSCIRRRRHIYISNIIYPNEMASIESLWSMTQLFENMCHLDLIKACSFCPYISRIFPDDGKNMLLILHKGLLLWKDKKKQHISNNWHVFKQKKHALLGNTLSLEVISIYKWIRCKNENTNLLGGTIITQFNLRPLFFCVKKVRRLWILLSSGSFYFNPFSTETVLPVGYWGPIT